MKRTTFVLSWSKTLRAWTLLGPKRPTATRHLFSDRRKAVVMAWARQYVRAFGHSQLVVLKRNGRIQFENTYGKDPARYPG